jgi:DNA modification methylase
VTGAARKNRRTVWNINTEGFKGAHFAVFPPKLVELCILAGTPRGHAVLDPFLGTGTVGAVSRRLGRQCIGIEMKPEFAAMASGRIRGVEVQESFL